MQPEIVIIVESCARHFLTSAVTFGSSSLPFPIMHSIYARINGISSLWSSCMMVLLAAIALSSFVFTANPTGKVDVASLKVSVHQTL
ncbi:hypothetical protein J3R82DRAFT_10903 [Butyriboletus roseoflavus]|nr:hypothetical protein J3R82DRAFT_10903 [Butyriboletus roseoflavus]